MRSAASERARAAHLLDDLFPDWYLYIDLDRLDMGYTKICILGQLSNHPKTRRLYRKHAPILDHVMVFNAFTSNTPAWRTIIRRRRADADA